MSIFGHLSALGTRNAFRLSIPVGVVSLEYLLPRVRPPVEAAVGGRVGRAAEADAAVPARRVEVAAVGRITVAPLKGAITDSVLTGPPLLLLERERFNRKISALVLA